MNEVIFLNGERVSKQKAKVSALEPGFLYGWGVFETMRAYEGKILALNDHLQRFKENAGALLIPLRYSLKSIKGSINECVRISGHKDVSVKLLTSKTHAGADLLIIVKRYVPYPDRKYETGFSACISSFRQNEFSSLAKVKSTNYLLYALSLQEARNKGFDEALLINSKGFVAEGSRTNLFLAEGAHIYTPLLASGCLNGITRKLVFALILELGFKVKERQLSLRDIRESKEAFLTNSLIGIMPLTKLENRLVNHGKAGAITLALQKAYRIKLFAE